MNAIVAHYSVALELTSNSAICTAFVAAPFRKLSLTHQKVIPSLDKSSRIRPKKTSSFSALFRGMGYVELSK